MMDQALSADFIVKERYKIIKELGRGGMGIVYLAEDLQLLSRPVVVKVLFDETNQDELLKLKFRQEMEALSRIDNPGVVGVLDAGELPDGKAFLVMQFIEGVSLREIMKPEGVEFKRATSLLTQIGSALSAAHQKGIIHRDLKPENIMIQNLDQENEQVKLIDFGLAKVVNSKIAASTKMASVVGSFGYMSPEQLTAKPVTQASDVYSLGVIAYEMLTGRRPFNPESVFELYEHQRSGVSITPRALRSDLPDHAQSAILKALCFRPEDRYDDVRNFCKDLVQSTSSEITPPPPTAARQMLAPTTTSANSRWFVTVSSVILALLLTIFAKLSFFRFYDWSSFVMHPSMLFCILPLGLAFISKLRKFVVIACCIASAVLVFGIITTPPEITFHVAGKRDNSGFTLNYSDPKGYRYTVVDSTECMITINPGWWNHLHDYTLELSLSPNIEFADVYFDKKFQLRDQLFLQPSNTNDILLVQKQGDDFRAARQIKFTYKYRNPEPKNEVVVKIKSGNMESALKSAFSIPAR